MKIFFILPTELLVAVISSILLFGYWQGACFLLEFFFLTHRCLPASEHAMMMSCLLDVTISKCRLHCGVVLLFTILVAAELVSDIIYIPFCRAQSFLRILLHSFSLANCKLHELNILLMLVVAPEAELYCLAFLPTLIASGGRRGSSHFPTVHSPFRCLVGDLTRT